MARTVGSAADETRRRILHAAVDLFLERGYAGTSVRDIAERLGMTKGSLYYHFAAKEDILSALVEPLRDDLDRFARDAAEQRPDSTLIARLVDLLDAHGVLLRSLLGDPSVWRSLVLRESMPARVVALQQALGGSASAADLARGRCALGVINAGVLAPRFEDGLIRPGNDGKVGWPARPRLSAAERDFIVRATLAVLSVS